MNKHLIGKWYKEEFGETLNIFGGNPPKMKISFSASGHYNYEPICVYEDGEDLCFEINDERHRMVYHVHYEDGNLYGYYTQFGKKTDVKYKRISDVPEDEEYRMMIPIEEIEASYRYLYGPDAVPNHHNIEEESQGFAFEYDPDNACYHVPFTTVSANYVPVLDTLKRRKDTVTVRVAYVSNKDVAMDDYGNEIPPTPDQATYTQIYTVVKTADGWALTSIAQET